MASELQEEWLGQSYREALAVARPFRIVVTRPPWRCVGKGEMRVIGQRQEPEGLCLVVTYPEFERLPRRVE